jgi:hypothetical protein
LKQLRTCKSRRLKIGYCTLRRPMERDLLLLLLLLMMMMMMNVT